MSVLFICTPTSIHDQKWIFRIASLVDGVFVLGENKDYPHDQSLQDECRQRNITLLKPLQSFSLKRTARTMVQLRKLNSIIKGKNIDVVHILFATPYAFWGNFIKVPFIITTRGSDVLVVSPGLKNSKGLRGVHDRLLLKLLQRSFKRAKGITSTSINQKKQITNLFGIVPDNIAVTRTGVDIEMIKNNGDSLPAALIGKKIIFSPRYMAPIYNVELQIEAIKLLSAKSIRDHVFVFIRGKGSMTVYQNRMIKELHSLKGLSIKIFDFLTQSEMWSIYRNSCLTLMVPHSDGTPNSALEAMIVKSPLILSNLDYDHQLFNQNTCLMLKENTATCLANSIQQALNHYPKHLLDNAFKVVKQNANINDSVVTLVNMYSKITDSRINIL